MARNKPIENLITRWEQDVLAPALERAAERRDEFKTVSGIPVERVYTPGDKADEEYAAELGMPGSFPFTRGVQPTMYRGRFWTMRQYAGFGSAEDTNKRYRYLLDQGQTGLSVAFDLPTQMGYDSDHPLARGEVGKVGVAISSLADMEMLFDGIPLAKVSTSMTINSTAAILLAMYCVLAEKQGADITGLRKWRSPSPTAWNTSRRQSGPGSTSTGSLHGCPSSSRPIPTSSKKWPSSGPRGGSGPGSCANGGTHPTNPAGSGSTPRPAGSR
jgi:hypothetical protein